MQNALLVALSRQVALSRELDVVANNIANINTNGFRREATQFSEYMMPVAREDGFHYADRRLSFVEDRATYHDFDQGPIERTDDPLNAAIQGDAFFVVQSPDGQGEEYTRDGSFQLDNQGRLVTSNGQPVLTDSGPLTIDPQQDGEITIAADGTISTKQGERGHLRLASFDNPQLLIKQGDNLLGLGNGQVAQAPATGTVRVEQGMLEKSNVKPVIEMSRLIEINRAYSTLAAMISNQDDLGRSAIDKLADIPA